MEDYNKKTLLVFGLSLALIVLVALAFVGEDNLVGEATSSASDLNIGDVVFKEGTYYSVHYSTPSGDSQVMLSLLPCADENCDADGLDYDNVEVERYSNDANLYLIVPEEIPLEDYWDYDEEGIGQEGDLDGDTDSYSGSDFDSEEESPDYDDAGDNDGDYYYGDGDAYYSFMIYSEDDVVTYQGMELVNTGNQENGLDVWESTDGYLCVINEDGSVTSTNPGFGTWHLPYGSDWDNPNNWIGIEEGFVSNGDGTYTNDEDGVSLDPELETTETPSQTSSQGTSSGSGVSVSDTSQATTQTTISGPVVVDSSSEITDSPEQEAVNELIDQGYTFHEEGYFTDDETGAQFRVGSDGTIYKIQGTDEFSLKPGSDFSNSDSWTSSDQISLEHHVLMELEDPDHNLDELIYLVESSTVLDEDRKVQLVNELEALGDEGISFTYEYQASAAAIAASDNPVLVDDDSTLYDVINSEISDANQNQDLYTVTISQPGEGTREVVLVGDTYYYADDVVDGEVVDGATRVVMTSSASIKVVRKKDVPRTVVDSSEVEEIQPARTDGLTGAQVSQLPGELGAKVRSSGPDAVLEEDGAYTVTEKVRGEDGELTVDQVSVYEPGTGAFIYSYRDDRITDDGRRYVGFKNGEFIEDSPGAVQNNGLCANDQWTCMSSSDNTGMRAGAQYAPSQSIGGAASIVVTSGDSIREITVTGKTGWPGEKASLFQIETGYKNIYTNKDGSTDIKADAEETDSGNVYSFRGASKDLIYAWDGDGSRQYYVGGDSYFFAEEATAVATTGTCDGAKYACDGVLAIDQGSVSAQGTSGGGIWKLPSGCISTSCFDDDDDGIISDEEKKKYSEYWVGELEDYEEIAEDYCAENDETCRSKIAYSAKKGTFLDIMNYNTNIQQAASGVAMLAGSFNSYSGISYGLSNLFCGSNYCWGEDFIASVDRWFAGSVLSDEYWESTVCTAEYQDLWNNEDGVQYIQTPSGSLQSISSIHASHSQLQPLLCQDDEEEPCPSDLECENDYCVDDDGEIAMGYLYSISWAVAAPMDEAQTPHIDENGIAVSFNIILDKSADGEVDDSEVMELYSYNGDTSGPLQLVNGDRDSANIYHWSQADEKGDPKYTEACIRWENAPVTVGNPGMRRTDGDTYAGGILMPDNCDEINGVTQGKVTLIDESHGSGSSSSGGSETSTTTSDGEVSYDSSW